MSEINTQDQKPTPEEQKPEIQDGIGKKIFKSLKGFLIPIIVGCIAGLLLVTFVIQKHNVSGDSMYPTLHNNDVLIVDKISRNFRDFQRGEIVVVEHSKLNSSRINSDIIKRIIGIPGDSIIIIDGNVYVNSITIQEDYLSPGTQTQMPNSAAYEITLGEDEYFCLGDNRSISLDSRVLGPIPKNCIRGTAFFRISPSFGGL